ncbi:MULTISPECIES: hypothetical protein [Burkholderiaceae]|uniref:hypothetical protein n=1 Tax=Burkholderiaceae TaxID=119060 RepID=UPI00160DB0C3|nr:MULTISPECIES: hypothetical protein [Burkholderiaceae]MBB2981561.1 hypothetical protein [Paraburkholderia tropica]
MAAQPRNNIKHSRFDDGRSKAIDEDSRLKGKSVSENIHDIVCDHLDGRDHLEALRIELIEQVMSATEQSTVLMVEAVSAAVSSKTEDSVLAALSDTGKSERETRARLQLEMKNLSNTVQAEIEKIDMKFKAISDTLMAIQKALAPKA